MGIKSFFKWLFKQEKTSNNSKTIVNTEIKDFCNQYKKEHNLEIIHVNEKEKDDTGLVWHFVVSSNLEKISYDEIDSILYVIFKKNNKVYFYNDVPQDVFYELLNAKSKGRYFYYKVRNKYKFGFIM